MTLCTPTPTSTLLDRIGDETFRRAVKLHDDLGLPRSCIERWVHDQRAEERREKLEALQRAVEIVRPKLDEENVRRFGVWADESWRYVVEHS